jgi:hypothetical protein
MFLRSEWSSLQPAKRVRYGDGPDPRTTLRSRQDHSRWRAGWCPLLTTQGGNVLIVLDLGGTMAFLDDTA